MHFLLTHIFCVQFIVSIVNTTPHGHVTPQNTYLRFKKFHASFRTISISTHGILCKNTQQQKPLTNTLPLKSCAQKAKKKRLTFGSAAQCKSVIDANEPTACCCSSQQWQQQLERVVRCAIQNPFEYGTVDGLVADL